MERPCACGVAPSLAFELAEASISGSHGNLFLSRLGAGHKHAGPAHEGVLPGVFPGHQPAPPRRLSPGQAPAHPARPSPAQQLQQHLGSLSAPAELRDAVLPAAGPSLERPSLVLRIGGMLQPQGETLCDRTPLERVLNVVTSLPFSLVGLHMLRQRQTPEGRHHAATLVAVGGAAALYHASAGGLRPLARKADYWTIAYSASEMLKALYPGNAWARRAAATSLLAVPFRPFVVSSVHTAVMEFEYIRQARKHKALRRDLAIHASTAAIGTAAFFLEDVVKEYGFEHMHGIWHVLSAVGVGTMNSLLAHKERAHLQQQQRQRMSKAHCSASSLADLQQYSGAGRLAGGK